MFVCILEREKNAGINEASQFLGLSLLNVFLRL